MGTARKTSQSFRDFVRRPYFNDIRNKFGDLLTPEIIEDVRVNRTSNNNVFGCINCICPSNQFSFLVPHLRNKSLIDYLLGCFVASTNSLGISVSDLIPCLYHLFESMGPNVVSKLLEDEAMADAFKNFCCNMPLKVAKEKYKLPSTLSLSFYYFIFLEVYYFIILLLIFWFQTCPPLRSRLTRRPTTSLSQAGDP